MEVNKQRKACFGSEPIPVIFFVVYRSTTSCVQKYMFCTDIRVQKSVYTEVLYASLCSFKVSDNNAGGGPQQTADPAADG